jgi:hypothetical protein
VRHTPTTALRAGGGARWLCVDAEVAVLAWQRRSVVQRVQEAAGSDGAAQAGRRAVRRRPARVGSIWALAGSFWAEALETMECGHRVVFAAVAADLMRAVAPSLVALLRSGLGGGVLPRPSRARHGAVLRRPAPGWLLRWYRIGGQCSPSTLVASCLPRWWYTPAVLPNLQSAGARSGQNENSQRLRTLATATPAGAASSLEAWFWA